MLRQELSLAAAGYMGCWVEPLACLRCFSCWHCLLLLRIVQIGADGANSLVRRILERGDSELQVSDVCVVGWFA